MAIVKNNNILATELTICHETNLESSKNYKLKKYKSLSSCKAEIIKNHKLVLGFLQFDIHCLDQFDLPPMDDVTLLNLSRNVFFLSFEIYTHRDSP